MYVGTTVWWLYIQPVCWYYCVVAVYKACMLVLLCGGCIYSLYVDTIVWWLYIQPVC